MLRNYLKVAWRNLMKNKGFTAINIFGLALGISICLLIIFFIKSERQVDSWRENADNVYRLVVERKYPERMTSYAMVPQSYAKTVKEELPEIDEATRVFNFGGNGSFQLRYEDEAFEEKEILMVDPSFFDIFVTDFIAGNPKEALEGPNSVVLNETTAIKIFGSTQNVLGKYLTPEGFGQQALEVTGVVKDWPEASHFNFNVLISTKINPGAEQVNFVNFAAHTYFRLHEGASPEKVEAAFPGIIEKFAKGNIEKQFATSYEKFVGAGNGYRYYLQPLKSIYLNSHLDAELKPNGNKASLYIFGIVAIFIFLIACINFINLSTARSSERAREVGIRKTFGSERNILMAQFLTESFLVSLLAMILAIGITVLLLPLFNSISGKEFTAPMFLNIGTALLLIFFAILTGLLAGFYPAVILSSFKPIQVLHGKFKTSTKGKSLRSSLVVFQFVISVSLIICTLIVSRQMNYMMGKKLGFDKEHKLIIERADLLGENTLAFKHEVEGLNGIRNVSVSTALPGQNNYFGISWSNFTSSVAPMTGRGIIVDNDYLNTLKLELVAGRFFSDQFSTDSTGVILNERAVQELGLQEPVGKQVTTPEGFLNKPDGTSEVYTILGVVKDFHYQSLREPIEPLIFINAARFNHVMNFMTVNVDGNTLQSSIAAIENKWGEFVKEKPFSFKFLDETVQAQYGSEQTTRKVFIFFSSIIVLIACIGLLGLTAYTTRQRSHEIGVRKVLGASVNNIIAILSRDFLKLIILASLIAFPIAWLSMNQWLNNFTYRISQKWDLFIMAGVLALVIAFLTILYQALKAAMSNPIKSIRTE